MDEDYAACGRPDARLQLVPNGRHAYFEECRTHASPLVLDFLTSAHKL